MILCSYFHHSSYLLYLSFGGISCELAYHARTSTREERARTGEAGHRVNRRYLNAHLSDTEGSFSEGEVDARDKVPVTFTWSAPFVKAGEEFFVKPEASLKVIKSSQNKLAMSKEQMAERTLQRRLRRRLQERQATAVRLVDMIPQDSTLPPEQVKAVQQERELAMAEAALEGLLEDCLSDNEAVRTLARARLRESASSVRDEMERQQRQRERLARKQQERERGPDESKTTRGGDDNDDGDEDDDEAEDAETANGRGYRLGGDDDDEDGKADKNDGNTISRSVRFNLPESESTSTSSSSSSSTSSSSASPVSLTTSASSTAATTSLEDLISSKTTSSASLVSAAVRALNRLSLSSSSSSSSPTATAASPTDASSTSSSAAVPVCVGLDPSDYFDLVSKEPRRALQRARHSKFLTEMEAFLMPFKFHNPFVVSSDSFSGNEIGNPTTFQYLPSTSTTSTSSSSSSSSSAPVSSTSSSSAPTPSSAKALLNDPHSLCVRCVDSYGRTLALGMAQFHQLAYVELEVRGSGRISVFRRKSLKELRDLADTASAPHPYSLHTYLTKAAVSAR